MSEQSQTAKLIAVMAECLPEMTTEERQRWIGDPEGMKKLLSSLVAKRWTEENGIITFTLPPTDGITGPQWIVRIEKSGNRVGDYAKQLLQSPDFKPTTGVVYTVKVLKGGLFSDDDRITKNVRAKANELKFGQLNAEAGCLIRENFTDKELEAMGLWWIIVMHEPIKDAGGDLGLLGVGRACDGRWLRSYCGDPACGWDRDAGFAFATPQVGSQT